MCPVTLFEFNLSKLSKECDKLFQQPRDKIHYTDNEWFQPRGVGHNTIETFMKTLAKDAKLERNDYTNHSIRSTVISNLDRNGFEGRHIQAVSGHKSEATIKECSVKCPENKKREMCDALADSIIPKKITRPTPTSTIVNPSNSGVSETPTFTLNFNNTDPDINTLKTENFDLIDFTSTEDDDILIKYLDENEHLLTM